MLTNLIETLFPKWKLFLYADEMKTTNHYHAVSERSKAWWDREGIVDGCSIAKPKPGFVIDHSQDGHVSLKNVEIQYFRTIDGY